MGTQVIKRASILLMFAAFFMLTSGFNATRNVYIFDTIFDALQANYLGVGNTIITRGYHSVNDNGHATYKIATATEVPLAQDSGYVWDLGSKKLIQIIDNKTLRAATYGVVCGDQAEDRENFHRLTRLFAMASAQKYHVHFSGCNDPIYVEFYNGESISINTTAFANEMIVSGSSRGYTQLDDNGSTGYTWFTINDPAKIRFVEIAIDGFDFSPYGGLGSYNQELTLDSSVSSFYLGIEGGNSLTFSKGGGITVESDPVYSGDPASGITAQNITNWTTAYQWGDHSLEGYLLAEVDGSTTNEIQSLTVDSTTGTYQIGISGGNTVSFGRNQGVGTDDQTLSVDSTASKYQITIEDGNTIEFGKGTVTETDPVYSGDPASGITGTQITNWDNAFSWGDHGLVGYLTAEVDGSISNEGVLTVEPGIATSSIIRSNSATSTDVTINAGTGLSISEVGNAITLANTGVITEANDLGAAVTWANIPDANVPQSAVTQHQAALTITESQISDLQAYLTAEVDGSTSNELQSITLDSVTGTYTLTLSNGGGSVKIKRDTDTDEQDISFNSGTGDLTITNGTGTNLDGRYIITEVDGSTSNELQTFSHSSDATTHTLTLSDGGGSLVLQEGSGITLTTAGNTVTLTASGAVGENNDGVNLGTGVGVYEDKVSVSLRFNSLVSQSTSQLTIAEDDPNDEIDFTIVLGAIANSDLGLATGDAVFDYIQAQSFLTSEINDLSSSVTWANVPDANITQSSVTQHQAALSITESQISDLQSYLTSEVDGSISNEGVLTVEPGIATSSIIRSNSATSTDVTINAGTGLSISEVGNAITLANTGVITEVNDLSSAVTWANIPDANVPQSAVTQHQAALTITESQISDLQSYLTAEVDGSISNELQTITLDSVTGTYTLALSDGGGSVKIKRDTDTDDQTLSWASGTGQLTISDGNSVSLDGRYLTSFTETNDLTAAVTWTNVPDANITQSSVTQHQAALTITESQISDLQSYLTSEVDGDIANEGVLGVSPGIATTSLITSNTSGSPDITIEAGTGLSISEVGTTITLANTGVITEVNDLTSAVTWANIPDANVPQSAVTQHQAALTITESQISDLQSYLTAEVDGSVSNELQTIANTSDATTHTVTLSNSGGSFQLIEGTGVTLTTGGTGLNGTVTIAASGASGEANDGLNLGAGVGVFEDKVSLDLRFNSLVSQSTAQLTIAEDDPNNEIDFTINTGAVADAANTLTTGDQVFDYIQAQSFLTSEVDGSVTNELQTVSNTSNATSHTLTLSNTGGSIQLVEGANISLTTTGTESDGIVTIAASGGAEVNDLTSVVTWANVPDANITQSSVTQHQAALSITESQISDLQSYLTAEVDGDISNEGQLGVSPGTASTSILTSNTSGSSTVTFEAGTGLSISEVGTTITLANTGVITETNDLAAAVTWTNVPDANITQSSVTQHQAALSITESQISDLQAYLTAEVDGDITNEGSLTATDGAGTVNISSNTSGSSDIVFAASGIATVNSVGQTITIDATETNDLSAAVTWTNVPDANITQSSVTQHQAALSITESQISDLSHFSPSTIDADYLDETVVSTWIFNDNGGVGTFGNYDLQVSSGTRGALKIGGFGLYSSGESALGTMNYDGTAILRAETALAVGNDPGIEFAIFENGNTARLLIPESGAGNAMALLRSVTIAGPYNQTNGNQQVTGDYWTTNDTNLDFDTGGSGADLFVQDDTEIGGTLFVDIINEEIAASGVTVDGLLIQDGSIPQAAVTEHQAALSITESQISDLQSYLTSEVDGSISNEGSLTVTDGAGTVNVASNTSGQSDVIFAASGIATVNSTGQTITIDATEVDGSTSNELQTFANTSDATTHTVTLSNSGGSVQFVEGAGVTLTTTGTSGDGILTIAASGATGEANTASNLGAGVGVYEQKVSLDLQFNSLVSQSSQLTIAEDDPNNEIDFTINTGAVADAATTLTTGNDVFDYIAAQSFLTSEVDGSITNEGSLTVGAGGANTSLIQSNTSTSTDVTISGTGDVTVTESGSTITVGQIIDINTYTPSQAGSITANFESAAQKVIEVNMTNITSAFTFNVSNGWSTAGSAGVYLVRFYNNGAGGDITVTLDSGDTWYNEAGTAITTLTIPAGDDYILNLYTTTGSTWYTNE